MECDISKVLLDLDCPLSDEDRIQAGAEIKLLRLRLRSAQQHIYYLELAKEKSGDRLVAMGASPRSGRA